LGGRVLALVGGAAATLALCLPWASEDETVTVGEFTSSQALVRGGDEWTGWNLGGTSALDSHRPVPLVVATLLILLTLGLLAVCWLGFEWADRTWLPRATAAAALVLLVASLFAFSGIDGTFGAGHLVTVEEGVPFWRASVALVLVAATRVVILQEDRRVSA
jgi:hypothetical protein